MTKKQGFTLIEILLVFILITIITAISQPKFSKIYNSLKLQSQINEFTDLLKLSIKLSEMKQEKIILSITDNKEEILVLDKNMNLIKKILNTLNISFENPEIIFDKGRVINENKIEIEHDDFYKEIEITTDNIKAL